MNEIPLDWTMLSPERRRLIELLMQEEEEQAAAARAAIRPRAGGAGPLPLSFSQQRLWFLDQITGSDPIYNESIVVRLRGQLEPAILDRSLAAIVQRHEVLRTTFTFAGGQPAQVVHPTLPLALPLADLRGLPREQRLQEA